MFSRYLGVRARFILSLSLASIGVAYAGSAQASSMPREGQEKSQPRLSLKQAMAHPDWLGRQPSGAYWGPDSQSVYYQRKQQGSELRDLFRRRLDKKGNGQMVPLSDWHAAGSGNAVWDKDGKRAAYAFEGDIFVHDVLGKTTRQLTHTSARESAPSFLLDGRIAWRQGNSWFAFDTSSGSTRELVSLRFAKKPDPIKEPTSYIAKENLKLMGYSQLRLKNRQDRAARDKALRSANEATVAEPFYLEKGMRVEAASLSPTGTHLLLALTKIIKRDPKNIMMNWINDDAGLRAQPVRPRVADHSPRETKLLLLNLEDHSKISIATDSLPGVTDDPLADVKTENMARDGETYSSPTEPKMRKLHLIQDWSGRVSALQWHKGGNIFAVMLEAYDNKSRWLTSAKLSDVTAPSEDGDKPASLALTNQHKLDNPAWINYNFNEFGWLPNAETLYYLSEESGYSQLYLKPVDGAATALTEGRFEVSDLTLSRDGQKIFFKANIDHPGKYEIYHVATAGSILTPHTALGGMTDYRLSPDETKLLLTHSSLRQPPELYVADLGSPETISRLTKTVSAAFEKFDLIKPQIVAIPSSHGDQAIYAKIYWPHDYKPGESGKKRPAVVFNHGAGYLQNSHFGWSGYFREYMFNTILAAEGYVVLDMDYRASKGYGTDWRTAIYRQMGTPELQDIADGINWLADNANVDRARIGTYGGSYGGFLTFMAMFKAPDMFKAGAALRPVADWAHYNAPYTSNILNTPDIDPIAYERSSPLYFAEGLKGRLLINAPMVDDNVFFHDSVRTVQRLIELEKENWEMAVYPVEPHGFRQPSSWLDEYRRIKKIFDETLN